MALSRSLTAVPLASGPPHLSSVSIPIHFQCPLCLDVLRRPIQLPCCQRYLCLECFERGLELTSVNCGFCRRRVVGFARTKQYKVDEAMWKAIKAKCPFLGDSGDEREPLIEFFDEEAPPLHHGGVDRSTLNEKASGNLKAFYERQLQEHQAQVQEAEQRALEQTIKFLQNDPEFTASLAASSSPASSTSSSMSSGPVVSESSQGAKKKMKMAATSMATRSSRHRPVTRSALIAGDEKQRKMDDFLGASRTTTSHSVSSGHNLHRAQSTSVGLSSPRARSHLKINGPSNKYFLRSASHSPTPTKERRRQPVKRCNPLRQLTLDTTISPIALHTRSRDLKRASSDIEEPSKMLTRQGRRRRSWKCVQCTYTNTCFDSRCSMCRSLPPSEVYSSLGSQ